MRSLLGSLAVAALLAGSLWAPPASQGTTPRMPDSEAVLIPAGAARLGSEDREKGYGYVIGGEAAWKWRWFASERQRETTLKPYWIDLTLVTQRPYAAFVHAAGHRAPFISAADYQRQGFLVHPYSEVRPYLWRERRPPQGLAEHPVVLVSHGDAQAYCAWRGQLQGRTCHLPSEDQWEKAARGGDGRYFPWGSRWEPERLNTQERGPYRTTPVKAYPQGRSPYGLFDMAGNVFEWTATPGQPGEMILKSCSWDDLGGICRAAARHDRPADSRHILIGFRCACEAHPTEAGSATPHGATRRRN